MYKCYFINYTFVAKVVRKKLLELKFWVQISLNIVFLLLNFTIIRPGETEGGPPPFDPTIESEIFSYHKIMFETLF